MSYALEYSKFPPSGHFPGPSFADALLMIPDWIDLSSICRRDFASALRSAARFMGLPVGSIPCDCEFLNKHLFNRAPAAFAISSQRFSNVVSGVRGVLRRLEQHHPQEAASTNLAPHWSSLMSRVTNKHHRVGLGGLVKFCSAEGIAPERVDDHVALSYRAFLATKSIRTNLGGRARTAVRAWNRAAASISGWPQQTISLPPSREPYTVPLSDLPESFNQDVRHFTDRLTCATGAAMFAIGASAPRQLRPSTIGRRLVAIRQAVGALIKAGRVPSDFLSLRDLVQPIETPQKIFAFFWERSGRKATSNTAAVAETLRQIAKFHCCLNESDLSQIETWARLLQPPEQNGLSPKVRERLRYLIQPRVRALLLHLPAELMQRAARLIDDPTGAAQIAEEAVAIEILLVCPLRFGNVLDLRLDRHLQRISPGGRHITHIVLSEEEVKNGVQIHWQLPPSSVELIETWISKYRPMRAAGGNPFLFPGVGLNAREHSGLSKVLTRRVAHETGAQMHMHLFRHFAAWLYLNFNPGDYETVRRVLGHKTLETTIQCYCGLEADAAAARFDEVVLGERGRVNPYSKSSGARKSGASFSKKPWKS